MDSITVNRNPSSDNEFSIKKSIDDKLDKKTILRLNKTLQNYLKVFVRNDDFSLTKYDKVQITDTALIKYPNTGGYILQQWNMKYNEKIGNGKIQNFIRSTRRSISMGYSWATSLPPIGNSFIYIETNGNNHGSNVFL